jgi:hypothetical protein
MILNTPWVNGSRKTARNMTVRNVNGQSIAQGKRAAGTFTPSAETLGAQLTAALLWTIFRQAREVIRFGWTSKLQKQSAASAWYKYMYENAVGAVPVLSPTLDQSEARFSRGVMTPTVITGTASAATQIVTLNWATGAADSSQLGSDTFAAVITKQSSPNGIFDGLASGDTRADGSTIWSPGSIGTFAAADTLRVYGSFRGAPSSANAGTSSNDFLLTITVGA